MTYSGCCQPSRPEVTTRLRSIFPTVEHPMEAIARDRPRAAPRGSRDFTGVLFDLGRGVEVGSARSRHHESLTGSVSWKSGKEVFTMSFKHLWIFVPRSQGAGELVRAC